MSALSDTQAGHGYEPRRSGGAFPLVNCPFDVASLLRRRGRTLRLWDWLWAQVAYFGRAGDVDPR